jgi:hypothetical protein
MNKRIIYPTDDGGVAVIVPALEARREVLVSEAVYQTVTVPATENEPENEVQELVSPAVYRDETDEEFMAWISAKDVPAGKPYKIVDVTDIPEDRTFRSAWEYTA